MGSYCVVVPRAVDKKIFPLKKSFDWANKKALRTERGVERLDQGGKLFLLLPYRRPLVKLCIENRGWENSVALLSSTVLL